MLYYLLYLLYISSLRERRLSLNFASLKLCCCNTYFYSDSICVYNTGVVFKTAAMSGMGLFMIIFNDWKPLTSIAKSSVPDVVAVLNASLHTFLTFNLLELNSFNAALSFHYYIVYLFSFFNFLYRKINKDEINNIKFFSRLKLFALTKIYFENY